ncbi:MAG: antirestriction protein ArdA [Pseudomonadota bacterium]
MTTVLYAQPYDISATGFHFEDADDYAGKATALRNAHGDPVEEFEIQFIDGNSIDAALVQAVGLHQGDLAVFFEKIDRWDETDKQIVIIAAGECGYDFNWHTTEPGEFEVDLYGMSSLRDLAEAFVEEGLFGDIPERLQFYIDFDAIARDLSVDYAETEIAGGHLIYRCG